MSSNLTRKQKEVTAEEFFSQLELVHEMIRKRRKEHAQPIRIALVSSGGVDLTHRAFKKQTSAIKANSRSFAPEPADPCYDEQGKATWTANLILKIAPLASLYLARVKAHGERCTESQHSERTAQAVNWAVENRVHIILLFACFDRRDAKLADALAVAKDHGIITLAPARGANIEPPAIPFPALSESVFCIGVADVLGTASPRNPQGTGFEKYTALGEYLPGFSYANKPGSFRGALAVAAGIAALLLGYTSSFSDISDGYSVMRKLFALISESSATESYRYLDIISFFRQGNICEELIKAALTRKDYGWTTGNENNLVHLCLIDRGGSGEVHKVRSHYGKVNAKIYNKTIDQMFARKLVYRRPGRDSESEILNEVRAIEKLSKSGSHKHIVTVLNHGWLSTASYYSFDMESCDFDLEYYVLGHTFSRPSDQLRPSPYAPYQRFQTAQIMEQITNAIAFIHSKGEVHRDLKPRNVLYSSKAGAWKITDFGLTAQGESQKANTTVYARGTSGYRAPEMIRGEHQTFTKKVDIWALGCLLFEVFSGKKAFASDGAVLEYCILGQELQFMRSDDQLERDALDEILDNMLEVEPSARKSAEHFHTEFLSFLVQLQRV